MDAGGEATFGSLNDAAKRLAIGLSGAGVDQGRIVALGLPNSSRFAVAFLALLRLEATVALLPPTYGQDEWRAVVDGMGTMAYLTTPAVAARWDRERSAGWRSLDEAAAPDLVLGSTASGPSPQVPDDLALVKFTSGSTGVPKGIALTTRNVLAEADNVVRTLDLGADDSILAPVPLCHSYGFDLGILPMLYAGSTLVVEESFVPRRDLARLAGGDITVFLGVPTMFKLLLETTSAPRRLDPVRYLLSCTAPLAPEIVRTFHHVFHAPICQHYGSSETGAATNHVPSEVLDRPASVGRAMKGVDVQVVDQSGRPAAPGSEGEVEVRSAAVAAGYVLGRPTGPLPFVDGAFRMGDLGLMDAEGYLEILGRLDDLINVGGLKVSPAEVTRTLESLPAVREAATHGVSDPLGGEVVESLVVLRAPATEEDMIAFCRERLAEHKVPRRIWIVDELPRGPTGKVRFPARGARS